jgi:hypothetical protein
MQKRKSVISVFRAVVIAAVCVNLAGMADARPLRKMSCNELWYERNAIYADNGYCFESAKAIRVFGEACFPPYGRLSQVEKERVDDIKSWERRRGC